VSTEKPGTRIIVWAHNDHIGKFKDGMGDFLRQAYGNGYYAFGSFFNQGGFQARALARDVTIGALKDFTLGPAAEGSVEWYLTQTGLGNFLLDLRGLSPEEVGRKWLDASHPMRSIGLGFSGQESESLQRINLRAAFDGLVFIEKTTRARPNPTGLREAWSITEKNQNN
jgi:erythromycin esterase